jgi:Zn finger protein HypA/HybF involved in hydrogenase expression
MRSYRAKEGFGRPCSKCKKPIEGGTGYLKCEECGARYHPECASAGICQVCAEKELETDG